ncbi:hypothetical protein NAT51_13570 [Flavobacterium amniphilum]|uniref:hypothetical protein n=1 Tax=Flavobacterium amniphilum TaxID=1834035 RepID=UPI00202AB306|nr:hypothetical protein [Flavobacterium amniphilum]MCL9806559.1 hypothetical protein [Flavobacterium amniphilum]
MPNGANTIVHNKKSRRFKHNREKYTWTLDKYIGYAKYPMDGMLIYPDHDLAENLTTETVLEELNSKNCFDFDYNPNEGDNLRIYNPEKYIRKYLSFIYRNGKWMADSYNGLIEETEKFNYGNIDFE